MNFENIYPRVSPVDFVYNAHLLADWYILAPDQKQMLPGWAVSLASWEGRGILGQWLILGRYLVLGSDQLPSWSLQPYLHSPWPYLLSYLLYPQLLISSAVEQFYWKTRKILSVRARDFSLRFIYSLAGNPLNKAADLCHCYHHCSTKGNPIPVGRCGRHFPSVSSAAPTVESNGTESVRRCGQLAALTLPAAQAKVGAGTCPLSTLCYQVSSGMAAPGALLGAVTCPLCHFIAKTSEPSPVILA